MKHTPLLVWLLCWTTGALTYFLSVSGGFVPECIPFIDGCTSISKTGRFGYGFFLFKALMIPAGVLLMMHWAITFSWLRAQGETSASATYSILVMGVLAGVFLILYSTFLGSEGDVFRQIRRTGTIAFFLFTYLGQSLLAIRCYKLFGMTRLVACKLGICFFLTIQLIVFLLGSQIALDTVQLENAIEWQSAYLLSFLLFLTWLLWRKTGFNVRVEVREASKS